MSSALQSQVAAQRAPSSASQEAQGAREGRRSSQGWALLHAPAGKEALLPRQALQKLLGSVAVDELKSAPCRHSTLMEGMQPTWPDKQLAYLAAIPAWQVDGPAALWHG